MGQTELPLTEQLVKETHRILTQHTLTYRYKDAVPGEYTNTDMGAGDTIFGDHEELIARVPKLMEATQKAMEQLPVHPIEIAAQFHKHFIFLHPFRDGNGRLGRLLSNFILVKLGHPMILIESTDRENTSALLKHAGMSVTQPPWWNSFFHSHWTDGEGTGSKKSMNEDYNFDFK